MDPEFGNVEEIYAWTSYYELAITPCPVGGSVVPINRLELLAPLLGVCVVIGVTLIAIKKRNY